MSDRELLFYATLTVLPLVSLVCALFRLMLNLLSDKK